VAPAGVAALGQLRTNKLVKGIADALCESFPSGGKKVTRAQKNLGKRQFQKKSGGDGPEKNEENKEKVNENDKCRYKREKVGSFGLGWLGWLITWLLAMASPVEAWTAIKPGPLGPPTVELPADVCHGNLPELPLVAAASTDRHLLPSTAMLGGSANWGNLAWAEETQGTYTSAVLAALCVVLLQSWYILLFNKTSVVGVFADEMISNFLSVWGREYDRDILSARWVGHRRVTAARCGWKRRHRVRCRCTHTGQHDGTVPNHVNSEFCTLRPLFPSNAPADGCRGGGGGAAATTRKRNEKQAIASAEAELLQALVGVLGRFQQPKAQGHKGKGKGKSKGSETSPVETGDHKQLGLLEAIVRLVERAKRNPAGLLDRLQSLTNAAVQGRSLGKRKKKKPQKPQVDKGGKGSEKGKNKGQGKGKNKGVDKTDSAQTNESPWITVAKKKPKVWEPSLRPVESPSDYRLREHDWPGFEVVPTSRKLGAMLKANAKTGRLKQFVISCPNYDDAMQCIQMARGDQAKVTVLWPDTGLKRSISLIVNRSLCRLSRRLDDC